MFLRRLEVTDLKIEYKRDISGNYMVLYEKEEPDTSSYQIRMLVGNAIPSVLKCKVQGVDGQFMVCFDITSKQSVASLYEEKKMGYQDLKMILNGFVQVMEEMSEYLLNPNRLVLKPECIYVDLASEKLYFCYLPGYDQEVKEKFQELTEYILPKIDHEDSKAVMLGYGIYRRALEDSFHLEEIKKEVYQDWDSEESVLEKAGKKSDIKKEENRTEEPEELFMWKDENGAVEKNAKSTGNQRKSLPGMLGYMITAAVLSAVLCGAAIGIFPQIPLTVILAGVVTFMGIGMGSVWMYAHIKKKAVSSDKSEEIKIAKTSDQKFKSEEFMREEFKDEKLKNEEFTNEEVKYEKCRNEKLNKKEMSIYPEKIAETVVLSANCVTGPAALVSKEPGEFATIYLQEELTVIGKMENAADAVINLPTVSRIHAKIRKRDGEYYLTDLNSRNGTSVNGRMLKGEEDYCLQQEDEIDFAQARFVFLK